MSIFCDVEQHSVLDNLILMASIEGRIIPPGLLSPTRFSPRCITGPRPHLKI